jgi:peptidoglycan/xylan/chitin deacetylase (PgdA/CDA1 family)
MDDSMRAFPPNLEHSIVAEPRISEAPVPAAPGISIVIPTFERRDVVVQSVQALARLSYQGAVDVTVVVDGSTDGTAEALRVVSLPWPLRVVEQANGGAAAARNTGARLARGEILLFLDDDMVSAQDLLTHHAASHQAGADVVVGHIPLHPDSPPNMVGQVVGRWAEARRNRLAVPGTELQISDLLTGQMSVRRALFEAVGGFDQKFTAAGGFGNEDLDFGYRLLGSGAKVVFNAEAVSWQRYVVRPEGYLLQWSKAGSADVMFARKHPERTDAIFAGHGVDTARARFLLRPLTVLPPLSSLAQRAARSLALAAMARWPQSNAALRLLIGARDLGYWGEVARSGGVPRPRPVLVLAYHAIADLKGDRLLEPYAVPPAEFEEQLDTLLAHGFTFVSASEVLRALRDGQGLPRRPVLLTFDDCYEDLLAVAKGPLRARGIPALAFAVGGQIGGTNAWDHAKGGRALPLLDAAGLRQLQHLGVEVGAHSMTHPDLSTLHGPALSTELAGAADALAMVGLPRPRFLAYPFGRHDAVVRQAAAAAGYQMGFSLGRGRTRRHTYPFAIPRTEIRRGQTGLRLLLRLWRAPGGN